MIFVPNSDKLPDYENAYLSKYLDLPKFLYLIQYKQMYFTRMDHLEDPTEGMTIYDVIDNHITEGFPRYEVKGNSSIDNFIRQQQDRIKKREEKILNNQISRFVSCWFCDSRESFAMWNLYSQTNGVVIKIKYKTIFKFLEKFCQNEIDNKGFEIMRYGFCNYHQLFPPTKNWIIPIDPKVDGFIKDVSYIHENEFRFVVSRNPDVNVVCYDYTAPIQDIFNDFVIIAHPKMEDWKIDMINEILACYKVELRIDKSSLKIR